MKKCNHQHCALRLKLYAFGPIPGGGVLKLVSIKLLKKKITFLVSGFILVVITDVKIVQI
jgi:hypothetical protein